MTVFSIIIPVYNAERTLNRCLNSLREQSFPDFEVIMVDDGSEDESMEICRKFATEDQRFKSFYQKNSGPSKARNCGLKKAIGEWICFVDSDDYVSDQYLKKIYEAISSNELDALFIGYTAINSAGNEVRTIIPFSKSSNTLEMVCELSSRDLFGYTWIKAFRKAITDSICFDETMTLFEDEVFTCNILNAKSRISVLSESLYFHTVNQSDSLTEKSHQDYCILCDKVFLAWSKMLKGFERNIEIMGIMANRLFEQCVYYGFERDINVELFFKDLSETMFFGQVNKSTFGLVYKWIKEKNFFLIQMKRTEYRSKVKLSKYMKKLIGK